MVDRQRPDAEFIKAEQAKLDPQPMTGDRKRALIIAGFIGALVLIVIIAIAVGSGRENRQPDPVSAPDVSKYTQTWPKDYGDTTCAEWLSEMSPKQQFAGAADMLAGARSVDGGSGLPPDSMINEFADGVTTVCVVPDMALNEAAVGLYLTEPRFQP